MFKKILLGLLLISSTVFSKEYIGQLMEISAYGGHGPYAVMIYVTDNNKVKTVSIEGDELVFNKVYGNYKWFYIYREKVGKLTFRYYYLELRKEK